MFLPTVPVLTALTGNAEGIMTFISIVSNITLIAMCLMLTHVLYLISKLVRLKIIETEDELEMSVREDM